MNSDGKHPLLILASLSPRRRYLLEQAGLKFKVVSSKIDETQGLGSSPQDYVRSIAEAKATNVARAYPESWVIGADTIVLVDNTILGKPVSVGEARDMLTKLSGKMHSVLTGYCICCLKQNQFFSDVVRTNILFKELTKEEIEWYIRSGEPFDKAGAYAIQGKGGSFVKRVEGSYTNVVGLPVCEVLEFLTREVVSKLPNKENIYLT
nr:septum formation inhibitor Maf [Desulfobacterales bacterium]